MGKNILGSLRSSIFNLIIFGGLYTVAVTGVGQSFSLNRVNGSKVSVNNRAVGSKLIGQTFEQARYFSGRSEEVSQLSPVSAEQKQLAKRHIIAELERNPAEEEVPNDFLVASASGVDPDISLAAAHFQVVRTSKKRDLSQQSIRKLIDKHGQKDWFSDRSYANVLQLNLALNKLGV